MTIIDFRNQYWYKVDLIAICKAHEIPSTGTKSELEDKIIHFLITGQIQENQKDIRFRNNTRMRYKKNPKILNLESKVIPEGIRFNNLLRNFFKAYYQVEKFTFIKEMVIAVRVAEEVGDLDFSVLDLIQIYDEVIQDKTGYRQIHKSKEDATFQWNNFVKDFHADFKTKNFVQKHQIASFLWNQLRKRLGSKKYRSTLLQEFSRDIEKIQQS